MYIDRFFFFNLICSEVVGNEKQLLCISTGKMLSVTWSHDAKFIFSGSSDGYVQLQNLAFEICLIIYFLLNIP